MTSQKGIAAIQEIILAQDRGRIDELRRLIESNRANSANKEESLRQYLTELEAQVEHDLESERLLQKKQDRHIKKLEESLGALRELVPKNSEETIQQLKPLLGNLIGETIQEEPEAIAEAISPIMGEAIRVRIRDSRKDMIEALHPIIGATIQRAIAEFSDQMQRNIDRRMQSQFNFKKVWQLASARMRGVSPGEMTFRESLPFQITEVFVVQRESGYVIAHGNYDEEQRAESELTSSMLTAIRDFVQDSFGDGDENELDEIKFGEQQIIIDSGPVVYAAVVFEGSEPENFRLSLEAFVDDLHHRYKRVFRLFTGDPSELPNLQPAFNKFLAIIQAEKNSAPPSKAAKNMIRIGIGIAGILLVIITFFYIIFTIQLLPVAFPHFFG